MDAEDIKCLKQNFRELEKSHDDLQKQIHAINIKLVRWEDDAEQIKHLKKVVDDNRVQIIKWRQSTIVIASVATFLYGLVRWYLG